MSVMINKRAVRVCLAPMAGFTDSAMRIISREWGADLTFTEMVSAKAVRYGDKKTLIAPLWSGDKKRVLNHINKALGG